MRALGADLSLAGSAWATGPSLQDIVRLDTPARKWPDSDQRVIHIRTQFQSALVEHDIELVLIEGYSYASPQGAHQMGELGGVIRCFLKDIGIPYVVCSPNSRAMFPTGSGNAAKAQVTSAMGARTGITFPTDDHADALVLWCMTQAAYGLEQPLGQLPKTHTRALEPIPWPMLGDAAPVVIYKPPKPKTRKKAAA